jgi:hypothetical protein
VAIDDGAPLAVRSVHDLEAFLDRLAAVPPVPEGGRVPEPGVRSERGAFLPGSGNRNLMTFAPDGARGVVAYVDGTKAASA